VQQFSSYVLKPQRKLQTSIPSCYYVRNTFKTGDVTNVKLLITVWDQKTATKIYTLDFKKCHIKRHLIEIEQFDMGPGPVNAFGALKHDISTLFATFFV